MRDLSRIPALPSRAVISVETLPCPWCGWSHDTVDMGMEPHTCANCGRDFNVEALPDEVLTVGCRSETDRKYLEAMGITEADLAAFHQASEDKDMSVIEEIAAERRRQIEAEGWTPASDDKQVGGELATAGACYALHAGRFGDYEVVGYAYPTACHGPWPWEQAQWKPKNPRADLIRAAALLVAEIERLDRQR